MTEKDFREATQEWVLKFSKMAAAMEEINTYRGQFPARIIFIEEMLDNWIIDYFIPDEGTFFADQVLTRITLDGKVQLLREITRRMGTYEEVKSFLNEVDQLRAMRNKFAHAGMKFVGDSYDGPAYRVTTRRDEAVSTPKDQITREEFRTWIERAKEAGAQSIELRPAFVAAFEAMSAEETEAES